MYEKIAGRIIESSRSNKYSVEQLVIGMEVLINNTLTILTISIISALMGMLPEAIIVIVNFILIRTFSGGRHFKTAFQCTIATIVILLSIIFAYKFFDLNNNMVLFINIFSLIVMAVFAPYEIEKTFKVNFDYLKIYKIIACLIVMVNLFIIKSELLTFTYLAQSLSMMHIKKG